MSLHIFENIKEAILLFDKNGYLIQANDAVRELFGATETITPDHLEQYISDYSYKKDYFNFQCTLQRGR